jgi:carbamoyltransferase
LKYYIGISGYFHDSSIALIDESGNLIDFKKEEYFSRVKGDKSFPRLALQEMIKNFNLHDDNIHNISFYEKPFKAWLSILKYSIKNNSLFNELTRNYFKNIWKSSIIFSYDLSKYLKVSNDKIIYCDHHLSHTLSGAFYNKRNPITSIVIDGYGDESTSSIHHIKSSKEIHNIWSSPFPHSIGLFYSAITDYLGFAVNEGEYKVMGLAAYGKPIYYDDISKTIYFKNEKLYLDDKYYDFGRSIKHSYSDKLKEIFNIEERQSNQNLDLDTPNFQEYANIAASAQKVVENILKEIFLFAHKKTGESRFIFSGGVAMNSVAINQLSKLDFIEEIIIPPSPGDSGAAIGAAYYAFIKNNNDFNISFKIEDPKILSPGFIDNKVSDEDFFLTNYERISDKENLIQTAANLIAANEVLATCYKNIETGPRALGHRSMICNAHSIKAVNYLNENIKKRSKFRPIAPVTLIDNANKYFLLSNKIYQSYFFMGSVVEVLNSKNIEAVVHNDNTARVQLCNENHILGKILKELEKVNIYVLANTSFNISSDPIVYSLEDAYLAIERMNIKYLMTENTIYRKKI